MGIAKCRLERCGGRDKLFLLTTIFDEMKLARQKALELSKKRKEVKPIKYILKR